MIRYLWVTLDIILAVYWGVMAVLMLFTDYQPLQGQIIAALFTSAIAFVSWAVSSWNYYA